MKLKLKKQILLPHNAEREEYSGKESYKGKVNFKMVETDSERA